MDLLESVLRASNAQKYIENFRNYGIDASVLKLLDDEDLKRLGVDDPNTRNTILQNAINLQIPSQKRIEIKVDKEYMQLILYQINQHLLLHYANLSCALTRPDVTICDVRLTPAVKCLEYCIDSLGEQVEKLEYNVCPKPQSKVKRKYVISAIVALPSIFILYKTIQFLKR